MVLCPPSVSWDIEISPAIQQPGVISMGIRDKVNTADKTMFQYIVPFWSND